MEKITQIITFVNDNILWGIPLIVAILATGILITVRTKFLQVRKFKDSLSTTIVPTIKSIGKKQKVEGEEGETISQFEAFSAAISGTVGTGNIVGVAGALLSGGPGAIFWMWVSAFFGLVTNYAENVLGIYFRKKDKNGVISGGPMYYISNGLGWKWLAFVFAFCCLLAAVGMGMVQSNSISGSIQNVLGSTERADKIVGIVVGVIVAFLTALIIIGGIKRIGKVASILVPFMALLFLFLSLIIICVNATAIPEAFRLIFVNAFSFRSVAGGFFGYMIMKAMRYGFARGVFSNEAGLGSSVIAHSASNTKEPVVQGLWGIFEVFLDTFVICTLTALSILTVSIKTGKYDFTNVLANANISKSLLAPFAFSETFGTFGSIAFAIILPLFAFTTILAWSYYGEKAIGFIVGEKKAKIFGVIFKVVYVVLLAVGAVVSSEIVWQLDDMFNALMALPNLVALICLSGLIKKITQNYYDRKKGKNVEPMLSAYGNQEKGGEEDSDKQGE